MSEMTKEEKRAMNMAQMGAGATHAEIAKEVEDDSGPHSTGPFESPPSTWTIKKNDSLSKIAKEYADFYNTKVTSDMIARLNKIEESSTLSLGQEIDMRYFLPKDHSNYKAPPSTD